MSMHFLVCSVYIRKEGMLTMDLFSYSSNKNFNNKPLAERMKPKKLEDFEGQDHILNQDSLLYKAIKEDMIKSIIFYGPPGTGKTSLARVIAETTTSNFVKLNAVTSGVKELREEIANAKEQLYVYNRKTILFIDEIHRFNKAQQDGLLPFVEDGTIVLIGATTENPFFEINNAINSRSMIYRLNPLSTENIVRVLKKALKEDIILSKVEIVISDELLTSIGDFSGGDARKALNILESAYLYVKDWNEKVITMEVIRNCLSDKSYNFDKNGDNHYDLISAFIKSIRGSDPDATVYYLGRLLKGGEDPVFIARRILISASEDIGLANSNALVVAQSAFNAVKVLGMPECRITLSHAALYLALSPKSNSAYSAINGAMDLAEKTNCQIPFHLRDMTNQRLSKENIVGEMDQESYKYPHAYENNWVEQEYLPYEIKDNKLYEACYNGSEVKLNQYMNNVKGKK